MPRSRTPIGTIGKIHVKQIGPRRFEARARFRKRDGTYTRLRRISTSKSAAESAIKKAAATLADEVAGKTISPQSRFAHVAGLWLKDFEKKVLRGDRAPKSLYDYSGAKADLVKRVGELTCAEMSAGLCDETLKAIRDDVGPAAAKRSRTVLSQICGFAVRHGAMPANYARSTEALESGAKGPIRALEPAQRADYVNRLREHVTTVKAEANAPTRAKAWTDLPEMAELMLATGLRIGEALALLADDIDIGDCTVSAGHHLVRVAGKGIVRVPNRKGNRQGLVLKVPTWVLPLLRRRKLESGGGPLFATWNGQWQDPGNVSKRLRKASDAIGYDWVASRMFRHTTATHLGDSDVASSAISDQLGNTADVVERHYRRKRIANEGIAAALENLMD